MSQIRLKVLLVLSIFTAVFNSQAEYYGPYHSIDLRDHIQFGSYNEMPTHTILTAIENRPCHFLAPKDINTGKPNLNYCDYNLRLKTNPNIKFTRQGAVGPQGYISDETFIPTDKQEWTRTDVIYSVEFDGENSVIKVAEGLYLVKIILFIHDSQRSANVSDQYYFRKLTVKTDASQIPIDNPDRVVIVSIDKDISLSETYFEAFTDIAQRKLVLLDQQNKIKKVFPVGVGALDVRTLPGMDNFIGSMTEELKTKAILTQYLTYDEAGNQVNNQMMQERNSPSWYKGRPFLGILDENGTKYKEIGFHYQIDDDQLRRGFVSHGCIRVRDKDLYQLSTIVFKSTQQAIPIKVVNSFTIYPELFNLAELDHPYPKINGAFKRIIYADKNYVSETARSQVNPSIIGIKKAGDFTEVERFEWCRQNGKYNVLRYIGPWASVLGSDCLTRIATDERDINPFINYMLGLSYEMPAISSHQTTTASNYGSFDNFNTEYNTSVNSNLSQICNYKLKDAATVYKQLTYENLTYNKFAEVCGCPALDFELSRGQYKDGRKTYKRICR
jgi:hypothetical protein